MRTFLALPLICCIAAASGKTTLARLVTSRIKAQLNARGQQEQSLFSFTSSGCQKNCGEKCYWKNKCKDDACKNDSKNCDRLPGCDWKKRTKKCEGTVHAHNPHDHSPHDPQQHGHNPHDPHSHVTAPTAAPVLSSGISLSHFWDCNGQSIDASTISPFATETYYSPAGYAPQDPSDHGGAVYGESMWVLGAASPNLKAAMGGGYGGCLLIQNSKYAVESSWSIVAMVTSDCPGDSNALCNNTNHIDLLAPGFDAVGASTANVCGNTTHSSRLSTSSPYNGISKTDSEIMDAWWVGTKDGGRCDYDNGCNTIATNNCNTMTTGPDFVAGCNRFANWGWTVGTPGQVYDAASNSFVWNGDVEYAIVSCPSAFTSWVDAQYDDSTGPVSN